MSIQDVQEFCSLLWFFKNVINDVFYLFLYNWVLKILLLLSGYTSVIQSFMVIVLGWLLNLTPCALCTDLTAPLGIYLTSCHRDKTSNGKCWSWFLHIQTRVLMKRETSSFFWGFAKGSLWWKKEEAASFLRPCWSMSSLPREVSLPLDLQHNSAHRNDTKSSIPFYWVHQSYNSASLLLKYWHYWNSPWNSSTLLSGFSSLHSWCVVIILEEPKTPLHKSIGVTSLTRVTTSNTYCFNCKFWEVFVPIYR